jgi:hypothetical protein
MPWLIPFLLLLLLAGPAFAQKQQVLDVGLRLQKSVGLYQENGIMAQYASESIANEKLYVGFAYLSSRLGTAFRSNAIRQDQFLLSAAWMFLPHKRVRPLLRANTGYFTADYEEAMFDDLPNRSLLASLEAGLAYDPAIPLKVSSSLGYNLITGDGVKGPGTLYPVFWQLSLSWDILQKGGR